MLATRTPKQCRERYHQNLKPSLNHSPITDQEGLYIEQLVAQYGKKWAEIARHLNGRSDNAVKNWWNGGANRRRRESTVTAPGDGSPAAPPPVADGSIRTDNGTSALHQNGAVYPPQHQQPSAYPPVNQRPPGHQLPPISPESSFSQQPSAPFPHGGPAPLPQRAHSITQNQLPPFSQSSAPAQSPVAPLFNPGFSMGQSSELPQMHSGPPPAAPTSSGPGSTIPPYQPSTPGGPLEPHRSLLHDSSSHFLHRVSLPNLHASTSQYQKSPLGTRPLRPSNSVVFNSAYTSDSSGFRKSSSVQLSSNVDPHQSQQDSTSSSDSNLLPSIQSGGLDHRFGRRSSRSSSVFLHSSLRNRAAAAPYPSTTDEPAGSPFTRRFSAANILQNGYKSRTASIDGVSSPSDNEDPLSGASHSLSKYSLGSAANSRRNSHVVPMPDPSHQTTPILPPMASTNSPPPPTLLTLPAATALASVSGFNSSSDSNTHSFTPPPPKQSSFGNFTNPFAKRHSVGGYTPATSVTSTKQATPLSPINSNSHPAQVDGPPSTSVSAFSGSENSRPPSEVLESWGRSNSTSSARRSSSASSHGQLAGKDVDTDMDIEMADNKPLRAFQAVNDGQKLSISNLLS